MDLQTRTERQAMAHTASRPVAARRLPAGVRWVAQGALAALIVLLVTGCHHHPRRAYQPPPPPVYRSSRSHDSVARRESAPLPPAAAPTEPLGRPTIVETGMASWYGTGRRAADGSAFDKNAMTAAHKTLPLGTIVRVTNLANNESVVVRITDRGPFVGGRILDLSEGAAKRIDLYRMGVAKVRIEAFTPATASATGRWVVQTGAFRTQQDALDLKQALMRRYAGSRVIEFASSTGYWVRIDPQNYDKTRAEAIARWIGKPDATSQAYLVRID